MEYWRRIPKLNVIANLLNEKITNRLGKYSLLDKAIAIDFEAIAPADHNKVDGALDPRVAIPTHLSICIKGTQNRYIVDVVEWDDLVAQFLKYLFTLDILIIVYNAYYDIPLAVWNNGAPFDLRTKKATIVDGFILTWLVNKNQLKKGVLGLKQQTEHHLKVKMASFESVTVRYQKQLKDLEKEKQQLIKNHRKMLKLHKAEFRKDKMLDYFVKFKEPELELDLNFTLARIDALQQSVVIQQKNDFLKYAKDDALRTLQLFHKTFKEASSKGLTDWFSVEVAVRELSLQMLLWGVYIDKTVLADIEQDILTTLSDIEQSLYAQVGREFNINSASQLQHIIWDELKIPPPSNCVINQNGLPSTNVATLKRTAHPFVRLLLDYKAGHLLLTSYLKSLPLACTLNPVDKQRANIVLNSTGTRTGRFTSNGLPLSRGQVQNIPSRKKSKDYHPMLQKAGVRIRDAFKASPGNKFIVADLSQIELRLIAHVTQDPLLLAVYNEQTVFNKRSFYVGDIHLKTATLLNIERDFAKPVNFGLFYGMGASTFAQNTPLIVTDTRAHNIKALAFIMNTFHVDKRRAYTIGFDRELAAKEYFALTKREINPVAALKATLARPTDKTYDIFLSEQLVIAFKQTYPTVFQYHQQIQNDFFNVPVNGRFWHTISGRRLYFLEQRSASTIFNSIIQGSGADLLKIHMYIYWKYIYPKYPKVKCILQIHDELVFEGPAEDIDEVACIIKYVMEYPFVRFDVPILSSMMIGDSWSAKSGGGAYPVGDLYVKLKSGKEKIYNKHNWHEYIKLKETDSIEHTSCVSMLTLEQEQLAQKLLGPIDEVFVNALDDQDTQVVPLTPDELDARCSY